MKKENYKCILKSGVNSVFVSIEGKIIGFICIHPEKIIKGKDCDITETLLTVVCEELVATKAILLTSETIEHRGEDVEVTIRVIDEENDTDIEYCVDVYSNEVYYIENY